jgi:hypothetical protein
MTQDVGDVAPAHAIAELSIVTEKTTAESAML